MSEIEQIKNRLNIVEVVGSYLKLEKAGINYKAKCPFHNEKTPSFFVSPTRQSFYCFGCGEKGDIFTFIEKFEGLDFRKTLEYLADRAGVKLKRFKGSHEQFDKEKQEKEKLFEIMAEAVKIFENNLAEDQNAQKYLQKRGVKEKTVKNWRLGLAKDEWRDLHDKLLALGYEKKNLLDAGLIKEKDDKFYDTFRDRIIFPIGDDTGRVVAFSGRAIKESEKAPKYLNSPETRLYRKSEILHGFHIAKNHIRKLDYAVLVEGQMDLIMSHQAGVLNTVASSGTALSELHLKKIQKLSKRVIVAYDADSAGEAAAERAAALALKLGLDVKIASIEAGEDPASLVEKDPDLWKQSIRNSAYFTDFALNQALREKDQRKMTKKVLSKVLPLVSLIESDIEKSQFVAKIAAQTKVSEESVWDDLKKIRNRPVDFENIENHDNIRDSKEALLFEAERYGFQIDIEKEKADKEKRIELQKLKQKLQETASLLDEQNLTKGQEEKIKSEFKKIQKRIIEIS